MINDDSRRFPSWQGRIPRTEQISERAPDDKRFPVLYQGRALLDVHRPDDPDSIPWSLIEPHRKRAMRNHDQTLERLAERGGLSPKEIMCVLEDRDWFFNPETETQALARLRELLKQQETKR